MAEEPENHTIRLLQEIRKEIRDRFDKSESENQRMHADTREQFTVVIETVVEMAKAVNGAALAVTHIKESIDIIEHDIAGIKKRVERIEKHTGLVKA